MSTVYICLTLWRLQFFYKIRRLSLTKSRSSLKPSLRSTLSTSQTGTTNFRHASGSCPFHSVTYILMKGDHIKKGCYIEKSEHPSLTSFLNLLLIDSRKPIDTNFFNEVNLFYDGKCSICCIFQPAIGVLRTSNAGQNLNL